MGLWQGLPPGGITRHSSPGGGRRWRSTSQAVLSLGWRQEASAPLHTHLLPGSLSVLRHGSWHRTAQAA